ncbi:topoisomerase DNA-binding C4 zinc finger domain-containing protein [Candidatus Curtissbacteria bacterium]|nr:topoisomerase DNA-binding C4 zinc finger domain-containing protein [Candidatus Curtissbacteria bacterium]
MEEMCPKCGSPLSPITETATGRQLQHCSAGSWNKETKKNEGCDYVKWIQAEPKELDEKCPKCGSPVVMVVTRFGKKMKKCSTNTWNKETKTAEGCDFVEWIGGTTEELDEDCPTCGKKLVLYTTANGTKTRSYRLHIRRMVKARRYWSESYFRRRRISSSRISSTILSLI